MNELDMPQVENNNDESNENNNIVSGNNDNQENEGKKIDTKVQLPLARVRRIAKNDPDIKNISNDSAVLMAKTTELFIQFLVKEAEKNTIGNDRKIIKYQDLAQVVHDNEQFTFLADVMPLQHKKDKSGYIQTKLT
eukprot:TRINITY_DN1043_c2_g3_i2.p1 TRINITY_DN1043_c2_g3~~TRINITY_DN1043_c2_g3_i2.p1  ORF type:complete len:136 (+),score=40.69 TRINITY_DN1043_c2_g3_i2:169-576(+)